jgi:sterol desaturase/sphingolipid hydroxylase (fatty acid hydroxylase superfamily)
MGRTLTVDGNHVDEFGIDLKQPLFPQLDRLGENYEAWIHRSYSPRTMRRLAEFQTGPHAGSMTIFDHPWLERQTHMSWRLILSLWLPVILVLVGGAVLWRDVAPPRVAGWAIGGFLFWTLVEYLLHRVVFHNVPRSLLGQQVHFLAHGIHHLDPNDPTRLVFPPLAGFGIAIILYALLEILLPTGAAMASMAGLLLGYLTYDMSHYLSHHHRTDVGWLHFLKRYHLAHHHKDPDSRFGVSSPLWDVIFRSGSLKT